ncbi:MAG TPA: BMP family ABC transporter substrate-binding protein [Gaiellaceae bacterium]|nr:BMP family ABC transporter substrate-binding protein [Gaiellaceae bacterium]
MKKWRFAAPIAALAVVAALAVMLVGTGAAAPTASFKAGLVSDVGRFNDKGFNQNQLTGLKFAAKHIKGLQTSAVESRSASEYLPNFASLARKGYNIIIGAGFLLAADEAKVAKQFPNTKFAITDYDISGAPFNGKKSPNVEGLTYASQESSYLAGCLAGLMVKKQGGQQIIGVVGGVKIPPVDSFLAGYQAGAKKCNPGIKVLKGYSQDFIDQAKCTTVAQNQIDAGSQVEFNVAGPCGLGTLQAADDAGIWGIGVDVDQFYLHPQHVLTSVIKRVDRGVYLAIKGAQSGQFNGGGNLVFNLKNQGVGLGKMSPGVPAAYLKKISQLRAQIIAGKIKPPTKVS